PELPECEFSRRLAQRWLCGKRIADVQASNDKIVFDGVNPTTFSRKLCNRRIVACRRWGKQIWFEMDAGPHPMFHLGMTGSFRVKGKKALVYVRQREEDPNNWPPKFCKVTIRMSDGTCFAMTDARRFGRIRLCKDPWESPPVCHMGFDPLLAMPKLSDFAEQLGSRSTDIKAVLLDQGFAAGVGNWVADEVLYQAAIHPQESCSNLTPAAVAKLHRSLRSVIQTACKVGADAGKYPRTWLFHYRWAKGSGKACDGKGRTIKFVTSGGRTSAFVPSLQVRCAAAKQRERTSASAVRKRPAARRR
ncbi:FPG1, partial [Symbiodinium pilosum]